MNYYHEERKHKHKHKHKHKLHHGHPRGSYAATADTTKPDNHQATTSTPPITQEYPFVVGKEKEEVVIVEKEGRAPPFVLPLLNDSEVSLNECSSASNSVHTNDVHYTHHHLNNAYRCYSSIRRGYSDYYDTSSNICSHSTNLNCYKNNHHHHHHQQQESTSFSKLMNQADINFSIDNEPTSSYSILPPPKASSSLSLPSTTYRSSNSNSGSRVGEMGEIILSNITQDSFQLSVQLLLPPKVSVRDVVDIIADPEMLKCWCEPISALVVTEYSGGSLPSLLSPSSLSNFNSNGSTLSLSLSPCTTFPTSFSSSKNGSDGNGGYGNSNPWKNNGVCQNDHDNEEGEERYIYPDVNECDDDIIVPPAQGRYVKMERKTESPQQREEVRKDFHS